MFVGYAMSFYQWFVKQIKVFTLDLKDLIHVPVTQVELQDNKIMMITVNSQKV